MGFYKKIHKSLFAQNCTQNHVVTCIVIFLAIFQDEMAHQQKMKADKKALEQAKAKAAQKGPMGMNNA